MRTWNLTTIVVAVLIGLILLGGIWWMIRAFSHQHIIVSEPAILGGPKYFIQLAPDIMPAPVAAPVITHEVETIHTVKQNGVVTDKVISGSTGVGISAEGRTINQPTVGATAAPAPVFVPAQPAPAAQAAPPQEAAAAAAGAPPAPAPPAGGGGGWVYYPPRSGGGAAQMVMTPVKNPQAVAQQLHRYGIGTLTKQAVADDIASPASSRTRKSKRTARS